ncbi:hypothetical protein [Oligosphaera ethanolica]|uniref:Uncharacterized protein n=1 Tax=Oligosphaera ethanolica TaxID=760260 RepID=A0AAE4AQS8_9BACT|nr:hypothetical protein [Oligosphaera ethanolica]MDQ0291850.1 hypothetical protein [Oligosphaera ethanolica]
MVINDSYETDALHLTVSMALVVSTKQPFLVVHFRREAAEALKARPKIAQGKRRRRRSAALGNAHLLFVFLCLFGSSRRS